jgi:hypothetical protein
MSERYRLQPSCRAFIVTHKRTEYIKPICAKFGICIEDKGYFIIYLGRVEPVNDKPQDALETELLDISKIKIWIFFL